MTVNLGSIDRVLRVVLGLVLIAAPFVSDFGVFVSTSATIIAIVAGVILIATSAMRFCPIYRIFGIRTCKI